MIFQSYFELARNCSKLFRAREKLLKVISSSREITFGPVRNIHRDAFAFTDASDAAPALFKKILKKLLTNNFVSSIIQSQFEYHKNDCDEDGQYARSAESWRLLRANDRPSRDPSLPSRRTESCAQVDSFRYAA